MSHATEPSYTRQVKNASATDPRDWIPVQYLCTLYSKDVLQAICNRQIDHKALNVMVSALRRTNNKPLTRFGMETVLERSQALIDCVEFCLSGEVPSGYADPYSAAYAFLYTNKETDLELKLFMLKRFFKERGIAIKAAAIGNTRNPTMAEQLQSFYDDRKLEAIFILFNNNIRSAMPQFKRAAIEPVPVTVDVLETATAVTAVEDSAEV